MKHITTADHTRLSYRIVGEGKTPVLLVHGWMVSGAVFDPLIDALDRTDLRLIVPDLRGSGLSDKPTSGYTLSTFAEDLAAILEAEGKPAILVGHSMGGQLVQLLAAMRPELVSAAAVLCSVPAAGMPLPADAAGLFRTCAGNRGAQGTILDIACKQLPPAERDRLLDLGAATAAALHRAGLRRLDRRGLRGARPDHPGALPRGGHGRPLPAPGSPSQRDHQPHPWRASGLPPGAWSLPPVRAPRGGRGDPGRLLRGGSPGLMAWTIRFLHDRAYDVVEAKFFDVVLETTADVLRWRREVEQHLTPFGRRVDLLIDLDGLVVRPAASQFFGEQRSQVLMRFSIRSFRYNGSQSTLSSISQTARLYGAAANVHPNRASALAALLAERRRDREQKR